MRAVIRSMHSPDVNLQDFAPIDPEDVGVFVQVIAGPVDGPGDESFDIEIVTPRWLGRRAHEVGPLIGRHYLIVERWDWPRVSAYLNEAFGREEASTWSKLAARLARIGHWEFEDYQESGGAS